jgi:hypothetical protein
MSYPRLSPPPASSAPDLIERYEDALRRQNALREEIDQLMGELFIRRNEGEISQLELGMMMSSAAMRALGKAQACPLPAPANR